MAHATTTKLRPVPDRVATRPMAHAPMTTLRPLHDRVLIRRLEEQDDKHGSIIIPDTAKEKPQEGKVIAVGTGRMTEDGKKLPLALKEGDREIANRELPLFEVHDRGPYAACAGTASGDACAFSFTIR